MNHQQPRSRTNRQQRTVTGRVPSCSAIRCDVQAKFACSDEDSNRKSEHLCLVISPGRDRSQPGYHPTSTGPSRTQYRRSRSAENRRESNPVSAMRDTDYQTGQQQATQFHNQRQYQYHQPQQQHHRQALQDAGVGPGPAPRVPLNQANLSLQQLQEMAYRQQQQIDNHQQLLVAKEQRLKYLRQQDMKHHQLAVECERLRRLREKVETQEIKLRKLRSLRSSAAADAQQQPQQVQNGNKKTVLADLESIRGVFNEKEKELSMAVNKVEELTHQLEDLRSGRSNSQYPPQFVELERLRRELAYRKQLSEQQNQMIAQQRAQLAVGKDEIARIDSRVMELHDRLEKKRMMNQQLANQISIATNAKQEQLRAIQQSMMGVGSVEIVTGKNKNKPVSTVEPFQRLTLGSGAVPKVEDLQNSINKNQYDQQQYIDDKNATKYQTLPLTSRHNNNGVLSKKELQNVRFSDAQTSASLSSYQRSYSISTDHHGNYPLSNDNNNPTKSSCLKPTSSVAPVVMQQQTSSGESSSDEMSNQLKPALPPKPMTSQGDRNGSISPPPYVPAPPPGLISTEDTEAENEDSSITILRSEKYYPESQNPSEEGTSVDDDEMPSEEDDERRPGGFHRGSHGGGLTVIPNVHVSINRRIEMPPAFHFPQNQPPPSDLLSGHQEKLRDVTDNAALYPMMHQIYKEFDHLSPEEKKRVSAAATELIEEEMEDFEEEEQITNNIPEFVSEPESKREKPKGIIKRTKQESIEERKGPRRGITFDPLALLLDASLEGELELVKRSAREVSNPSASNDEGITALHNAICAGHFEIVRFLVEFGCDVNAPDSDGWTPLHCAASCNNLSMVKFLVEHGACIFATTLSDRETAAEKCEEDEEGFDGCSEYLYGVQDKLGLAHDGDVYAVYDYDKVRDDELSFKASDRLTVVKKGDENESEWWWSKTTSDENEGYIPRNLLGLYPRVQPLHQNGGREGLTVIQEEGKENEASAKEEDEDAAMSSN